MSDPKKTFPKIITYEEYRKLHPAVPEPWERPAPSSSSVGGPSHAPQHAGSATGGSRGSLASAPMPPKVSAPPEVELLSHSYDEIQEFDNPTPSWWYLIFIVSIVFSVLYVVVYDLGGLVNTPIQRHDLVKAAAEEKRFAELSKIPMSEAKITRIMAEPAWLEQGAATFQITCAICHSPDGSGLVGPNLTDEVFKNIRTLMDIPELITNGAGNGVMPAQRGLLNENEIALVAAYAASLRGQNLPTNPLVGEQYTAGDPIAPWPVWIEEDADEPSS